MTTLRFDPPVQAPLGHESRLVRAVDEAVSIVRAHAIDTGDGVSIRLVRMLKNAETFDQVEAAATAFRIWCLMSARLANSTKKESSAVAGQELRG
jgi:hypothetical protein